MKYYVIQLHWFIIGAARNLTTDVYLIYLFRYRISELPRPIVKLDQCTLGNANLKMWGQNMQNLGRFYATSDFDR